MGAYCCRAASGERDAPPIVNPTQTSTVRKLSMATMRELNAHRLTEEQLVIVEQLITALSQADMDAVVRAAGTAYSRLRHGLQTFDEALESGGFTRLGQVAIGEILRAARVMAPLVMCLDKTQVMMPALSILWRLSSDAFEPRACETRVALSNARALDAVLSKIYLSPSAVSGSSLPDSDVGFIVFFACALMANLCTTRADCALISRACSDRLAELANGTGQRNGWTGEAVRRAAKAVTEQMDRVRRQPTVTDAPASEAPAPPLPAAAPIAATSDGERDLLRCPSHAELFAFTWEQVRRNGRRNVVPSSSGATPLLQTPAPARSTDNGVVAMLMQCPTFEYCQPSGGDKPVPTRNPHSVSTCTICLEDFQQGDELRALPCLHCFHTQCIDAWLLTASGDARHGRCRCPTCRFDLRDTAHEAAQVWGRPSVGLARHR